MSDKDKEIAKILESVVKEPTYLKLWSAYKKIQRINPVYPNSDSKRIRLAVIGSSTLEPLAACIDVKCRLAGFHPETFTGGFNTFRQEVLDKTSELYKKEQDLIIVAIEPWSLLDQDFIASYVRMNTSDRKQLIDETVGAVSSVSAALESNSSGVIVINNLLVPPWSPFGILDIRQSIGLRRFFLEINRLLEEEFSSGRVYLFDLDTVASSFGKSNLINWNTYYRGSVPYSETFTVQLAEEYMRYVCALKGQSKKCIVLDLDNTLWGGIIGEDGLEGIKLGTNSPGNSYLDFQRYILSLYNRGVILAVNSKNNFDDAIAVLRKHPHQVLREEHFAALRINWQDKVSNMVELANEINIGLESMVFIDDNPVEREQVRLALPDVTVVDLPKNPNLYRATLEQLTVFDTLALTKEDMTRGEMYVGRRKRTELQKSTATLEDFLRTLNLTVRVHEVTEFETPRVVQLIGKTNQFNLTTRRYSDAEVRRFIDSPKHAVYSMAVTDKFGDEGVVGVAIVRKEESDWWIDSLLMSCRVIGRSVETSLLAKIVKDARAEKARRVYGEYIPTKKNAPAADLYERHGFGKPVTDGNGVTSWILELEAQTVDVPDWIELIEE